MVQGYLTFLDLSPFTASAVLQFFLPFDDELQSPAKKARIVSLYRLQAGVIPLIGVKSKLAFNQKQYNLLAISIIITTISSFNYKGSLTIKRNRYKAFDSINNTG